MPWKARNDSKHRGNARKGGTAEEPKGTGTDSQAEGEVANIKPRYEVP